MGPSIIPPATPNSFHHSWARQLDPPDGTALPENPRVAGPAAVTAARVSGVTRRSAVVLEVAYTDTLQLILGGPVQRPSPSSGPCITSNRTLRSSMLRAIGPTTPSNANGPIPGSVRLVCGREWVRPQFAEMGRHAIDPPPSLPTPPADMPAAMAAPLRRLDPPGVREMSPRVVRPSVKEIVRLHAMSSSGALVTPRMMAPAWRRRATGGASRSPSHAPPGSGQSAGRRFYRTLDTERDAVQHAEFFALTHRRLRHSSLPPRLRPARTRLAWDSTLQYGRGAPPPVRPVTSSGICSAMDTADGKVRSGMRSL